MKAKKPNLFFCKFIKLMEALMKNIAFKLSFLLIFIVGVAAVSAFGQSTQYRGTIPFDFTARGVKMKAGDYVLGTNNHALMLRDRKRGTASILGSTGFGSNDTLANKGKLIFARDGDDYVLLEVNTPVYNLKIKGTATSVNVAKAKSTSDKVEIGVGN
jgi:hypothetical protein